MNHRKITIKREKWKTRISYLLGFSFSLLILSSCWNKATSPQKQNPHKVEKTISLPYDRWLQPAGKMIVMGDSTREYHALHAALSPDKKWLAVLERYSIVFINTTTDEIAHVFLLDSKDELKKSMTTFSGITWYYTQAIDYVFFSASLKSNKSFVVQLAWDGTQANLTKFFGYTPLKPAKIAIPNEIIIREESGRGYLYVVLNGNNRVVKQDIISGETIWSASTGVAPYGLTIAHNKVYVTNWAGRIPQQSDRHVAGVPWGQARIDSTTGACNDGSVSIFDTVSGKHLREIVTGLHPNAIISNPDENYVYLTNSNSDVVTAIDTKLDAISETIPVRLGSTMNGYFGDSPNGLAITSDGKTLYVANGMDNALAVVKLGKKAGGLGETMQSKITGFIPTAAYPSSISILDNKRLYVTNLESMGPTRPFAFIENHAPVYNTHRQLASISVIEVPGEKMLEEYTETVIAANQLDRLQTLKLPARKNTPPRPVPERIGEPSVFKHVLYIIKENRTYDQVLGDVKEGNGDSSLCTFGKEVTPNQHELVKRFGLMDNFFASGKCSAEGHNWTNSAIVTDYIEKNVRAWFRSYPHVLDDAMAYAPTGFLWDNARKHGVNVTIYGEAATPIFDKSLTWLDIYSGFLRGEKFDFTNKTTIRTVEQLLSPTFPGYDGHKIPDVLRADVFIDELKKYEAMNGDSLPQLMVMALPNDHTAGTRPNFPTPRAMVADNDLALGRIVEAISKSRFWKNTVIFVVEDDSQAGWDHISAYRTLAMVISPYSKNTGTIHTAYNQPAMVRTIEQILGLPPMNIQDAIAEPMVDCFNDSPDFSPWMAVPNQIPLDEMNPALGTLEGLELHYAKLSLEPQFDGIDSGEDQDFNRILWFATKGDTPYPEFATIKDFLEEDED